MLNAYFDYAQMMFNAGACPGGGGGPRGLGPPYKLKSKKKKKKKKVIRTNIKLFHL